MEKRCSLISILKGYIRNLKELMEKLLDKNKILLASNLQVKLETYYPLLTYHVYLDNL